MRSAAAVDKTLQSRATPGSSALAAAGSGPPNAAPLHGSLAASMERLAGLAATALRAPVACIVLVGDDRRCFAAGPKVPAWCAHDPGALRRAGLVDRVAAAAAPITIPDLRTDDSYDTRQGAEALEIVGFVGVPLRTPAGECLGVFCAGDTVATTWTAEEVEILVGLAGIAAGDLELRQTVADHEAAERRLRHDALHDGLTGLANRAAFSERCSSSISTTSAASTNVSGTTSATSCS
jgi:GAF domain-containing protein